MNEKMREEFEAWAITSAWLGLVGDDLEFINGGYVYPEVKSAWLSWQASRESLVIDLSDLSRCFSPNDCGDWAMWLDDVRIMAQAAGLKVKL
jgi:hypothetical protein